MTFGQPRYEFQVAQTYGITFGNRLHLGHGRKCQMNGELRIVRSNIARPECSGTRLHGGYSRTRDLLQRGNTTGMIEVRVRVENEPDILCMESQRGNILQDEGCRVRQSTINQDMTGV